MINDLKELLSKFPSEKWTEGKDFHLSIQPVNAIDDPNLTKYKFFESENELKNFLELFFKEINKKGYDVNQMPSMTPGFEYFTIGDILNPLVTITVSKPLLWG